MCGIAGIVGSPELIERELPAMAAALATRGPDGLGFCSYSADDPLTMSPLAPPRVRRDPAVGLAHRRLAIIDTSTDADQPFFDKDGTCALVFNGEIYNYLELRAELQGLGVEFRTESDSEVLLAAYRTWGPACVERFVGIWAFAILDTTREVVFLSRDHVGVKPLYYARLGGSLAFASEIKALVGMHSLPAKPDMVAVSRYLRTGTIIDTERTFFEGVEPFPPGSWCEIDIKNPARPLDVHAYWQLPSTISSETFEEAASRFRECFFDAVRLQLRSDVPLGTCLSGGIDSSSIVAAATAAAAEAHSQHPHLAFGYVSEDEDVSERPFMELVARATDIELVPVTSSVQEVAQKLPEVVAYHDEPFGDASIVAQWLVFERAHEAGMKVMLAGEGADEMLGGYHGDLRFLAQRYLRQARLVKLARFHRRHTREIGPLGITPVQALRALTPRPLVHAFHRGMRQFGGGRVALPGAGVSSIFRRQVLDVSEADVRDPADPHTLHELLVNQFTSTNLPQLLRYEDRNSMAHSIEARVPFLDHRLVELVFAMSEDKKIRGVETKAVLRRAMRGAVPDAVLDRRDKIGFRATPAWTYMYAREHRDELADNQTAHEQEWFDPRAVTEIIDTERRDAPSEYLLWRVLNTKLWARALLD